MENTYYRNLILICALVFMLPAIANAGGEACTRGELEWTFDPAQNESLEQRTGRLHGTLETPHPGYHYVLEREPEHQGDMMRLTLHIRENEKESANIMVISPLTIDEDLRISTSAKGIFIDVIKTFGWGPEYFTVKFKNGAPYCMPPEMYK